MSCKSCGKELCGDFIVLSGGALYMNRKTDSGGLNKNMDAFLGISVHSDSKHIYESHDIIPLDPETTNGQFEIYFCSKQCTQTFFTNFISKITDP